ncbi:MAG: penicillin-binding protein 2, partial [Candidatus Aminicenantes bacterium]|nr:penicillin-binding protein 2 [Candidatus Aminicenantes bacterium]NIN23022.1 penicillin-binding protein 2 [Candidatus Aminicenantes bacterium]NIN46758.1 penicillin-binding protein 2 [Candidatus Aminicenantes bacterium]NIN89671.1 penicillin-binding protein 2 [Candidatus Aminicenantes bacterium]NIO86221.1 penicillin-binding protein 2 [Candidatus Aminicenantes bacterium]
MVGLVPDPEWKERVLGERWFLGNTYHFAIGQADLLTTPLQINMMTAVIANNGKLCKPVIANFNSRPNTSDGG